MTLPVQKVLLSDVALLILLLESLFLNLVELQYSEQV